MGRNDASTFFSGDQKERIRQAVEQAEETTAGEIATMVVNESDSYREAETLGAVLVASLVAVVIAVGIQHVTIWSYIPLVIVLFLPTRHLFRLLPRLKLPFAGSARLEEAVRERALQAFYEKGLYRTQNETGILIFISLLERKVWILGDRGISNRIDTGEWKAMAAELARGLKEEQGCDALCAVIKRCGQVLARHFPPGDKNVNELEDTILT